MDSRKQIGIAVVTLEMPIYEGETIDQVTDWFIYDAPGISEQGELLTIRRETTLKAKIFESRPDES